MKKYKIIGYLVFVVTPITAEKNYSEFINDQGINFPTGKF